VVYRVRVAVCSHATVPRTRREHVVTLRLSSRERERLYHGALVAGVSGSELLREALVLRLVEIEREITPAERLRHWTTAQHHPVVLDPVGQPGAPPREEEA